MVDIKRPGKSKLKKRLRSAIFIGIGLAASMAYRMFTGRREAKVNLDK